MKMFRRALSLLALACVAGSPSFAFAQDPPGRLNAAEFIWDRTLAVLGTDDIRNGFTLGIEWGRGARIAPFRTDSVVVRELMGLRMMVEASVRQNEKTYAAAHLSFGARWTAVAGRWKGWYVEAGTGPVVVSRTGEDINNTFSMGTFFGVGRYTEPTPDSPRYGLRFIHISNAGAKPPNPSANFLEFVVGIQF